MNRQQEIKNQIAKLKKELEELEKVKPVFPLSRETNFGVYGNGKVVQAKHLCEIKLYIAQGNAFYTKEEAEKESKRRAAEVRVRERINLENKGDNRFTIGIYNFMFSYNGNKKKIEWCSCVYDQYQNTWEYLRTQESAEKLLKDEQFCRDWLLMKGIKF